MKKTREKIFGISFRHFSGKCDKKCKHLQSEKRFKNSCLARLYCKE
jgi:hypothetical protein